MTKRDPVRENLYRRYLRVCDELHALEEKQRIVRLALKQLLGLKQTSDRDKLIAKLYRELYKNRKGIEGLRHLNNEINFLLSKLES